MEKSDLLLLLLLDELLPNTGTSFHIKHTDGELENDNWNSVQELLTEKIKDEFYSIIIDKLEEILNKKYPERKE